MLQNKANSTGFEAIFFFIVFALVCGGVGFQNDSRNRSGAWNVLVSEKELASHQRVSNKGLANRGLARKAPIGPKRALSGQFLKRPDFPGPISPRFPPDFL